MSSNFFNYLITFLFVNSTIVVWYFLIKFLTKNKYKYVQLKVSAKPYFIDKKINVKDYFFRDVIKKIFILILIALFTEIVFTSFNIYFLNKYLLQGMNKNDKIDITFTFIFSELTISIYLLSSLIVYFVYLAKIVNWRKINSKNKWKNFEDYFSISYQSELINFFTKQIDIESQFKKTEEKIRLSNFDLLNIVRKKNKININEIYDWCILDYDNTYIDKKQYTIEDFATFFNAYRFNIMFKN